ncbi:ankyrin repeat domain-containing protein [Gimesia maris]|uniref:Ankyrin repeat domain-containing protein n=1 Tax=Gimesia maris TaxID=122 RepID=A0ABX5YKE9_9PLAN|nr:ankyrin repeat domain-containing protein [Gimesia maris]QEG16137.1 hypothetical protein GmarT_19980 [Gimesia maris]QGQ30627.1 ankyrin repeat domain-containing protein [Gimesia maris]
MVDYSLNDLISAVSDLYDLNKTKEILGSGININTINAKGLTPLMFAVMPNDYGDHNDPRAILRMVLVLLSYGADISMVDSFGNKAKDYAAQLIDPKWKDEFGYSAVEYWDEEQMKSVEEIICLLDD